MSSDVRRTPLPVWVFALFAAIVLPFQSARGQSVNNRNARKPEMTGSLSGTVVDPTGAVIPGAEITLSRSGAHAVSTSSDSEGSFAVSGLEPGTYNIEARAKGFSTIRRAGVKFIAGGDQKLTIKLPIPMAQSC